MQEQLNDQLNKKQNMSIPSIPLYEKQEIPLNITTFLITALKNKNKQKNDYNQYTCINNSPENTKIRTCNTLAPQSFFCCSRIWVNKSSMMAAEMKYMSQIIKWPSKTTQQTRVYFG